MAERQYVILEETADEFVASLINTSTTATRAALSGILPSESDMGGGPLPVGLVTAVMQRSDGSWPTPVRTVDGPRIFQGLPGKPYPRHSDGLRPADLYVAPGVFRRCLTSDGVTPTSWTDILTSGSSGGGVVVTDPGDTSPTPDDTPTPGTVTPQMTVRPATLIGSTGTWSSTGSTSLIEALSDQHLTGVVAAPSSSGGGVSIRVEVNPLLMQSGNDLLITLWGLKAPTSGTVTVAVTRNGSMLVPAMSESVGTTSANVPFRWKAADLPIMSSWDRVVVEVSRAGGGLELLDLTVQSVPPVTVTQPPTGTVSASSMFGGVFASDLRSAPTSIYTADKRTHLASAGPIILGCYDDAPMVVTATTTTSRVKVTTSASGGNRTDGTGWADSVPIPAGTKSPTNRWKTLLVVSPETGEQWEFLNAVRDSTTGAWSCSGGGKIAKAATSGGVMPVGTGITGSGLSLAAPRITLEEARKAKQGDVAAIAHTLGLNLPGQYAQTWFTAPATRTDGDLSAATEEAARKTVPLAGDRVRLRKDFDTSKMTGFPKAIAEALKTFGAVIMGWSAKASIICESGEAEQGASGIEPWGDILAGQGVDQVLSWLKASDLEFIPAGWLSSSSPVSETPITTTPVVTPTNPTTPTTPTTGTSSARIQINLPSGVRWASGASCRAIENSSEGMGSAFAQWRGEGCYFARTWWDQPGATPNDTLVARYGNFHAPIDCGPGFFYKGESMAQAAAGAFVERWRTQLRQARAWWQSRRDPQRMQVFMSPAHEMNGSWYPHSVNRDNVQQFVTAWKRYRELQLQEFPECILTFNVNRDSSFYSGTIDSSGRGMDWRSMVPGVTYGGEKVTDWVDCGAVDYYNMDPHATTLDEFNRHALEYDSFGAPKGIERHRQFWQSHGLCMTVPEWSGKGAVGDWPAYMDGMNQFFRKNAGTGPGQIPGEALFNLSTGFPNGLFAVYADTVVQPNAAARYRALTWGN